MGVQPSYGKGPRVLLWASSWATHGKMTVGVIPNGMQHCEILKKYIYIYKLQKKVTAKYNLVGQMRPTGRGF